MTEEFDSDDDLLDDDNELDYEQEDKSSKQDPKHTKEVRQRLDDLLERRRLKELLDDTDDWDI